MKKIFFGMMIAMMTMVPMLSGAPKPKDKCADSHMEWMTKSLEEMQTIKEGMTRRQLKMVFLEEGGISTRVSRTYVFRDCQYIKVNVEFKPVGDQKSRREGPEDVITEISKPFLQWSHID